MPVPEPVVLFMTFPAGEMLAFLISTATTAQSTTTSNVPSTASVLAEGTVLSSTATPASEPPVPLLISARSV